MKIWIAPMIIAATITIADSASLSASVASFHGAPAKVRSEKNPLPAEDPAVLRKGARVFGQNCAGCHGAAGTGSGNIPSLVQSAVKKAAPGELFWFIKTGSPKNGMPALPLTDDQRWHLVALIQSLGTPHAPKAVSETPVASGGDLGPRPAAPFTDFRFENPGQVHKILPHDLPAPAPQTSVGNGPKIVPRPEGAWPKVPPGFRVELYQSSLESPRRLLTAPNGDVFVAEMSVGKIRVLRGLTKEGKAKIQSVFAKGLDQPYGLAFYPPGPAPQWLYVANTNAVVRIPYRSGDEKARGPAETLVELPHGRGHSTRDLQFSLDGKALYVSVGSASNVDDVDTTPEEKDRATVWVMNPEGKNVQIFASGVRNAGGGLAIQPDTGALWGSSNERDALGDNLVPDYITHFEKGGFYGWPWWYIGSHQDPRHQGKHPELKDKVLIPDVLLQPHHASLQLAFYQGTLFPEAYKGDIFAAQHGSWNRTIRTGYEVIRIPFHGTKKPSGEYEDFMTGFVVDNQSVWGRPVGVTVMADGSLLVSDDGSNSIWRVTYK